VEGDRRAQTSLVGTTSTVVCRMAWADRSEGPKGNGVMVLFTLTQITDSLKCLD
jgi:hypothetical protein